MQELPLPWAEYVRLQARTSQNFTIDSYSWGIEEEMNLFVADPCAYASEEARSLKRLRATASRRERSRESIRNSHEAELAIKPTDTVLYLESRQALAEIQAKVSPAQWDFLWAIGEGEDYADASNKLAISVGAARTQMFRFRRQFADLMPAA
jgi:DNA-directed RNA polymerase specialized sigma24 family protein